MSFKIFRLRLFTGSLLAIVIKECWIINIILGRRDRSIEDVIKRPLTDSINRINVPKPDLPVRET